MQMPQVPAAVTPGHTLILTTDLYVTNTFTVIREKSHFHSKFLNFKPQSNSDNIPDKITVNGMIYV